METKLFGKYLSNILDTSVRMIHVKFRYQLNRNVSTVLQPAKNMKLECILKSWVTKLGK